MDIALLGLLFSDLNGGEQGTDTDPCRAQIVYLVNFQTGINFVGICEDVVYLIRSDGVQSAAKGIKLNQIQILSCFYKACRGVETGVVHPLVGDDQRSFRRGKMGNGILGKHRDIIGGDQLGDTVVNLRVNVVGTACKNDAALVVFLQITNYLFALVAHILSGTGLFLPSGFCCIHNGCYG